MLIVIYVSDVSLLLLHCFAVACILSCWLLFVFQCVFVAVALLCCGVRTFMLVVVCVSVCLCVRHRH